ncbi:MAG TPA: ATP-binding protein [Terriglobia bacterium]|nr:ATP-binding protein [Terriglobia bacterium]
MRSNLENGVAIAPADVPGDSLRPIPSPTFRLGLGLGVILSTFAIFAIYATRQVRWLEDFQTNVVERNRRASLQLLRLQNDAYLLAVSLHDLALASNAYPIRDSQPQFTRLESDMQDALEREGQVAVSTPLSDAKQARLAIALQQFRASTDQVFSLAAGGDDARVRQAARAEMEPRRVEISEEVSELLRLNDQAQDEAAQRISAVYSGVKRDVVLLTGLLFLLALGTGLYTFAANRSTFERLQHLTDQLRAQSEQLRKLSWKLIDVQEDMLRQVSRDLHDEFGQILTGIGLMLRRAGQRATADAALVDQLEEVKHVAAETLQRIREQSQMFRPAVLDDFGLEQTLEWLAGVFEKQSGTPVHFEWNGVESALPAEASIHVYRVVQEALNNVTRHSKATEAWVTVERRDHELQVEIRDDGTGFDPSSGSDGLGLTGMRERAQHLHGILTVDSQTSASGHGTAVRLRVPLAPASQAPLRASAEKVV